MDRATLRLVLVTALIGLAFAGAGECQVVLSEVMFDPAGSEFYDEYVEVQNLGAQPVDLAGWRVGDGDEADEIVAREGGLLLGPGAFGLILDAGYFAHSTQYDPLPEGALVLTVADATLGRGGLNNQAPERVLLISAAGDTVGAMAYTVGNPPGFSEEKVDPEGGDGPENWADSRRAGGTPGRINSVSKKVDDLALVAASEGPFRAPAGAAQVVELRVVNVGRRTADAFEVVVSGPDAWAMQSGGLPPGDSLGVGYPVPELAPGRHAFGAEVRFAADQDTSNNRVAWEVVAGAQARQAVVSEVMFAPSGGEPEWVELFNRSGQHLDLSGWQVQDSRPASAGTLPEGITLPAGAFAVVAEDAGRLGSRFPEARVVVPSRWPRLNDGGDAVVVRDAAGVVVDSMVYTGGAPGRSLERIDAAGASEDPQNWLSSTDPAGATPGRANSVSAQGRADGVVLSASPNPFWERVEITYRLPVARAEVSLWVFDSQGRRVKALLNGEPGGSRRLVGWNGEGEGGARLKPGIYILLLEAAAEGRVYRARTPVALAKGL